MAQLQRCCHERPLKLSFKGAKSWPLDFFRAADIFFNLLEIYMAYINPYGRLL